MSTVKRNEYRSGNAVFMYGCGCVSFAKRTLFLSTQRYTSIFVRCVFINVDTLASVSLRAGMYQKATQQHTQINSVLGRIFDAIARKGKTSDQTASLSKLIEDLQGVYEARFA